MQLPPVVVVDDDPLIVALITKIFAGKHEILSFPNAREARAHFSGRSHRARILILDWEMPELSGLDFLRELKKDPANRYLPVIMVTGRSAPADVEVGIQAGAFYYLTKPFDHRILRALVDSAISDHEAAIVRLDPAARRIGETMAESVFCFKTTDEARELARWLASTCPDAEGAQLGLHELLINAVEHGNLNISHEEKSALLEQQALGDEIRARLKKPEYSSRRAEISFKRKADRLEFEIRDQGRGFDFRKYLSLSPDRAFSSHGRGIALARNLCFDSLEYSEPGNRVTAIVNKIK
ncbi:MAG: response regulator [Spirochaetia bacterium]|nr:response regulator [Spirochaetia bacterium]